MKQLNILHLDDHEIFFDSISGIIKKEFPAAQLTHIQNGDEALQYISDCLQDNITISLIITDNIHPGMGWEKVKSNADVV